MPVSVFSSSFRVSHQVFYTISFTNAGWAPFHLKYPRQVMPHTSPTLYSIMIKRVPRKERRDHSRKCQSEEDLLPCQWYDVD